MKISDSCKDIGKYHNKNASRQFRKHTMFTINIYILTFSFHNFQIYIKNKCLSKYFNIKMRKSHKHEFCPVQLTSWSYLD